MYSLKNTLTLDVFNQIKAEVEQKIVGKTHLEQVAQQITHTLYENFKESMALVRVYVSVPYMQLPMFNQQFVLDLANKTGISTQIKATTPILSLMGTSGIESAWNDRLQSKGHIGIPLVSTDFIGNIPMMAQLLKDLGADIEGMNKGEADFTTNVVANIQGLFFVDDASTKLDGLGRKVIAAQDFVEQYGIKAVFGFGGKMTFSQNFMVVVCFTKEKIDSAKANAFLMLNSPFKNIIQKYLNSKMIFNR